VGRPDNPDDYLAVKVGEFARRYGIVYIPWDTWHSLAPASQEFVFYVENQGRCRLEFEVPIRWLKGL
jgi:hypothetical protein